MKRTKALTAEPGVIRDPGEGFIVTSLCLKTNDTAIDVKAYHARDC